MSKKSFIDSVKVGVPCTEDWEKMRGNDRVRFCSHCTKEVNNLSAISRKEAARLVRASGGNICIRYIANPVTQQPMFGEQLIQITRRTPAFAAGIMSASLALSTMSYAQTVPSSPEPVSPVAESNRSVTENEEEKTGEAETTGDPTPGSIEGIILDILGNPVPNVQIMLDNADGSGREDDQSTDAKGRYKFEEVEPGTYTIRIMSSSGLWKKAVRGIELAKGEQSFRNIYVKVIVPEESEGGTGSGYGEGWGGAMASVEYDLPLNRAVADNDIAAVRRLLAEGQKVNGKDKNYNNISPLHVAVENGNVEIVKLLLDNGANVNARNESKLTPLMFIDSDATPDLIKVLLNAGAKVNARDESEEDVLLSTIDSISVDVLNALIKGGADVRHADKSGVTAMMKAAENEDLEKVTALVLAGANVDERDENGESAWDKTSSLEIEQFLEKQGASADNSTIEVIPYADEADGDEEETDESTVQEEVTPPKSTIEEKEKPSDDKPVVVTVVG